MKNLRLLWLLLFLIVISISCGNYNIKIIPLSSFSAKNSYDSVQTADPEQVKIYRSQTFNKKQYDEIGFIVINGSNPDIKLIYKKIREHAQAVGATIAIGFRIRSINETESTVIDEEDDIVVEETSYTFSASATLLRRKK